MPRIRRRDLVRDEILLIKWSILPVDFPNPQNPREREPVDIEVIEEPKEKWKMEAERARRSIIDRKKTTGKRVKKEKKTKVQTRKLST